MEADALWHKIGAFGCRRVASEAGEGGKLDNLNPKPRYE
jgi:hypothetical protein